MCAHHPPTLFRWRQFGLIDWHRNLHHANTNAVQESPDQEHGNVDRATLNSSGNDAYGADDLNGHSSTQEVQEPEDERGANDTTAGE